MKNFDIYHKLFLSDDAQFMNISKTVNISKSMLELIELDMKNKGFNHISHYIRAALYRQLIDAYELPIDVTQ